MVCAFYFFNLSNRIFPVIKRFEEEIIMASLILHIGTPQKTISYHGHDIALLKGLSIAFAARLYLFRTGCTQGEKFGENCNKTCNCRDNAECAVEDGCPGRCAAGFAAPDCQQG